MTIRRVYSGMSNQPTGVAAIMAFASLVAMGGALSVAMTCTAGATTPIVSTGLKNLGNTCYMNAQLECAFHIPAVRDAILAPETTKIEDSQSWSDDSAEIATIPPQQSNEAITAIRELFDGMIKASLSKSPAYAPRSFCIRLGIPPMVQQDSQEFWKLLLSAIGSETLSELYKGVYVDYVTALDGSGRERRRDEIFLDLSLDVSSSPDLLSSLEKNFGEPELLSVSEGNGWRPEKGSDKVDAHKGSALVAKGLPPILQIHLKRFTYDWQTDKTTKLNKRFVFPEELDLSSISPGMEGEDEKLAQYVLQSVLVHVGEYGAGHYYSYVRPDVKGDSWYRFNDDVVEKVSFEAVSEDVYGGMSEKDSAALQRCKGGRVRQTLRNLFRRRESSTYGWGGQTSNAYVVQYVRRKDIPFLYKKSDIALE